MRYRSLDVLRGFALVNMIIYHGLWNVVDIFGAYLPRFTSGPGDIWQQCICFSFILLSGFCFHFGRHKARHALVVLACSAVISVATLYVIPQNKILFGVLSLLGSAMLFMIPLDKILKKVNPFIGAAVALFLFVLLKNAELGIFPKVLYADLFTAYLGFPPAGFESADYFPIFPWFFLYAVGYFLYGIFRRYDLLRYLNLVKCRPLEYIGRHSLIIYMLHQPILYGTIFMIYKLI